MKCVEMLPGKALQGLMVGNIQDSVVDQDGGKR